LQPHAGWLERAGILLSGRAWVLLGSSPMSFPATLLSGLASLIAPERCPACRAYTLADEQRPPASAREALAAQLCAPCQERLDWLEVACRACALPRGPGLSESRRCSSCRSQSLGRVRTTTALYRYRGPGRHVLRRLKYEGHDPLGRALGRALGERLRRWRGELLSEELVICPVPLHAWRRLGRGYNQAELIAAGVAEALERPLVCLLRRRRATRALYGVRRHHRDQVLSGAFRALPAAAGARVLLVDDIRTSGATLRAAGRALHEAGARRIDAAVVAC